MKLLVLSDTHGRVDRINRVQSLHADADAILFLGDGLSDICRSNIDVGKLFCVRGNCDGTGVNGLYAPDELSPCFENYSILMMHGHTHGVKRGTELATRYAAVKKADILLFGHTHLPYERYLPSDTDIGGTLLERPLYVFNPGSLGAAWGGRASYGLIQMKNRNVLFSHGYLD